MSRLPYFSKPGRCSETRSFNRSLPCSISIITAVVVAITLVSEAASKIVSAVIGSGVGCTARRPTEACQATPVSVPTATTAPGSSFRAMAASINFVIPARRTRSNRLPLAGSADARAGRTGRAAAWARANGACRSRQTRRHPVITY